MGCVSSKETRQILVPSRFCPNCKKQYTQRNWCKPCESRRFSEDFHNWTSGNTELDQFIRYTQLNSIAPLTSQWVRESEKNVALKRLNGSNHAEASFWQELRQYHCINQNDHIRRCYGFKLMESCWDANPKRRPDMRELEKIFMSWGWHMGVSQKHDVFDQFISAENERKRLLNSDESEAFKKPHPEAIYKSRLLKFPELPKPVNRSSCLRTSAERSSFFFSGYEEMLLYKPINTYDSYERVDSREISFPVSDEDLAISFDNISSV
ncbi:45673_t:CDS:2 [Gigaspora margarita]|uniref:45673_t:CDS:1 n=1 Tax=Gigaspora margarita TaxID=4874 RepID=A0ABN7V9Z9_GIGMA|nr:45673_t:CDS:2 [Gigaspora margarita]